jgi:neutral trehalase
VDLNCYLVRECRAFARLATWAGKHALAAEYTAKADARAERIRALCWDDVDGFFYDRNARAGEHPMSRRAGWASALNAGAGCGLDPFWGCSLLAHFMPYDEAGDADITAI